MRVRSSVLCLLAVTVLSGALGFWGCAKRPEVTTAGPPIVGPGVTVTPGAPGTAGSSQGDVPVARPMSPTETPIPTSPRVSGSALPGAGAAAGAGVGAGAARTSPLKAIFFQYDKALIEADQKAALDDNVRWLKANGGVRILIEGHCDERGTAEYNLGLGDRRAKAVQEYLMNAGILPSRIGTISYGKERPLVPGHDENAWKQNRRAHFTLQGR